MICSVVTLEQINQIKGLELISSVELAFDSCLTRSIDMTFKEISASEGGHH